MQKHLITCWVFLAGMFTIGASHAAGAIDFLQGNVVINNSRNELRVPQLNDRIEVGDTIVTGQDGEAHIVTDDQGIIAIRSRSQLQIDTYRAEGRDDDVVVLKLLRGGFRAVGGWVGRNDDQHVRILTPTATIRPRGADHEALVVEDGPQAGTYDKVNSGSVTLATEIGSISVDSHQAGFAARGGANPPITLQATPAFIRRSANESLIDGKTASLEKQSHAVLQQKLRANVAAGGDKTDKPRIGDAEDQRKAGMALEELFRNYEAGNVNFIHNSLDPSMIGFQQLLDRIAIEASQCKQMRIRLYDTQVQAGPDLAVIQSRWEKRCLMLPAFTPRVDGGFSTFLMHKDKAGWGMAALSGANPFASSGTLATLVATSSISCSQVAGNQLPQTLTITLNDPDLAGAQSVNVNVITSQGDQETIPLNATVGGNFSKIVNFNFSPPVSNNNVIDVTTIVSGNKITCPSVTVIYSDTTTPSGLPQAVQASLRIR